MDVRGFLKDLVARATARLVAPRVMRDPRYFELWQERGFHVTPVHFYQPVPDTRRIRESLWSEPKEAPGVDFREAEQLAMLASFASSYQHEYDLFPKQGNEAGHDYYLDNGGFRSVDAELLYCMIRHFRPRRMIEVGSGLSTRLAARALRTNAGETGGAACRFTAIEPYPDDVLRAGLHGLTELIASDVQDVPLEVFRELGENDILFIDSSHVLRTGSDVQYEYLEILPRLRPGVLVHVHDIFLPAEYPRSWVLGQKRFWSEQYLLQAFLAFNEAYRIEIAASYLHLRRPEALESAFRSYDRSVEWPGSFWIKRIR
jgi:predicted O-methyltransferase YrrM